MSSQAIIITHSEIGSLWREMWDGASAVGLLEEQWVAFQIELQEDITLYGALVSHTTCEAVTVNNCTRLTPSERLKVRSMCVLTVWRQCSMERGASWECSNRRL